ncbi:MAG: gluconolactonase [Verrucomicrobiaceae bacterium]|nr:gluconolactonase [Verrucomicrobiaceae bacterium]
MPILPKTAHMDHSSSRRSFFSQLAVAGSALTLPSLGLARDWSGRTPVRYPDEDIVVLDDKFKKYKIGNTSVQRLHTGSLWAEGCAWNSVGRYLVWSDIPNNIQRRYLEEDGHTSVMRNPAGNSNGNTFDIQGRQLSCEHGNRRVVRYEHDGRVTVIADKFEGKRLNAPNDIVVHPNGGIWFTDPGYGSMMNYEGHKGSLDLKEAVYRVDPGTGSVEKVTDALEKPNGLCFSPDYNKLYIADTGSPKNIMVYDVVGEKSLKGGKEYVNMNKGWVTLEGGKRTLRGEPAAQHADAANPRHPTLGGGSDGIRCDVDGNVWSAAGWVGAGYDGVHVFTPEGQLIGQIKLPEIGANLCFGGEKRNRLFIAASTSIYSVYVETQGAHFC